MGKIKKFVFLHNKCFYKIMHSLKHKVCNIDKHKAVYGKLEE